MIANDIHPFGTWWQGWFETLKGRVSNRTTSSPPRAPYRWLVAQVTWENYYSSAQVLLRFSYVLQRFQIQFSILIIVIEETALEKLLQHQLGGRYYWTWWDFANRRICPFCKSETSQSEVILPKMENNLGWQYYILESIRSNPRPHYVQLQSTSLARYDTRHCLWAHLAEKKKKSVDQIHCDRMKWHP